MTAGRDLVGGVPSAPRKRGRPPGSKNRRAADLKGWVDAKAGSSAAMQSAQLCLVTVAELKAAGGDHAQAVMAKAAGHVRAYQAQADGLDGDLQLQVGLILERLIRRAESAKEEKVLRLVEEAVAGIRAHAGRFSLADAVEAMAKERAALMPYTDQRQPQLVAMKGEGFAPVMVMVGGSPDQPEKSQQIQGPLVDVPFEVLQPKSHDAE